MVTSATFNRIGVSNDSTLNNVYLYNGVTALLIQPVLTTHNSRSRMPQGSSRFLLAVR